MPSTAQAQNARAKDDLATDAAILNLPSEPLPLPTGDFAVKARSMRGSDMDMAYHEGMLLVHVRPPNKDIQMTGIIKLKAGRMVMLMPNLPNMALEMALPPQYAVTALKGTGKKLGASEVAGEVCHLWLLDKAKAGRTISCITPDGIALRTQMENKGAVRTVYEVTQLTRAPQDPSQFEISEDVKLIKVSRETLGGLSSLPGIGRLLSNGLPALSPD
ncbi:hypothetical protein ACT6QH_05030 [Xanthobacter sp. TB0139]|uniref:hypothetical protein n=1 Tax=Xanthobacter sp. TB0139 TaxID=3459178 RepID=UPI00403A3FD0